MHNPSIGLTLIVTLCSRLCICDLWGSANLVALMIAELDNTPLYFTDDIGIVFGPPTH
jgi:hypothetical protein